MGNTSPLIETAQQALEYKQNILDQSVLFEPVMCIMLTQDTTPAVIREAKRVGIRFVKFIPVGTSTGAVKGLRLDDLDVLYRLFPVIEAEGMFLLIHAELISRRYGKDIPHIEREEAAMKLIVRFRRDFPTLKITIEHASTARMIYFVWNQDSAYMRATLAPQHALLTFEDVCDGVGRVINPYNFCLPVAKTKDDRRVVRMAMASGDIHFFAGSDSAPHWLKDKLVETPKAGIFFGEAELPLSLEIFEEEDALVHFENFHSRTGAKYYGFPLNSETLTLVQENWESRVMDEDIRYTWGGRKMRWRVIERNN